jgi:hypothetical protein
MSAFIEIPIGSRYFHWTVREFVPGPRRMYKCACDCGREKLFSPAYLRSGNSHRCIACRGSNRRRLFLVPGQQVFSWTVIEETSPRKYRCRCGCGAESIHGASSLLRGDRKQCKSCAGSSTMKEVWKKREESGEGEAVRRRIGLSLSERYRTMSQEERRSKCTHNLRGNISSLLRWREKATDNEKKVMAAKIRRTMEARGLWTPIDQEGGLRRYREKVRQESERNYRRFRSIINPDSFPRGRGKWHLDHILPIADCFRAGVSVVDAAKVSNLRMLPERENIQRWWREKI